MKRPSARDVLGSSLVRLILPALLLAGLTGCATAKVPQFQAFATAGTTYTQAVTGLITEVGNTAVDANSVKLLQNRSLAPVSLTDFNQQDQDMRNYLGELTRIQAQVTLLGDYFNALAGLATSSAPQSFGTEVQTLATTLVGVTQEVKGTTIAKSSQIATAAGSVGGLVVKGVQGRELKKELEARKQTISDILQLNQVLLATLSSQTEANVRFTNAMTYDQQVIEPFMAGQVSQAQQTSWMSERLSGLSKPVLVQQVNTAAEAARDLQQAWNKLLSNDLTAADIQTITSELAPVIASLEALKPKSQTTTTNTNSTGSTGGTQP
ncbi:MAG TPA: hypothetical protein VH394_02225 [Thermoanaerobaculia bacterium]|jgi:hypothetical protein|nr:hypothetical protein [Thermoanaerobaculia bacterium]